MENDMYIAPLDMGGRSSTVIDENTQHPRPKPIIHCYSFDLNSQNFIINGIPMLSVEQNEPTRYVQMDGQFTNPASIADDSNPFATSQGTETTPASLAARIGLQENLENSETMSPSLYSSEALGPYIFNNWLDTSYPLAATFGNRGYDEVNGNEKWNVNKFLKVPEVDASRFQPYSSIGNMDSNGWTSSNAVNLNNYTYNSSNFSNELSLSLATSPTTSSEKSCSDGQASCSNRELFMSLVSNRHVAFSPAILRSRYLAGIQEILAQIAAFSFENLEEINNSAASVREGGNKSSSTFTPNRRVVINHNENAMLEGRAESPLQKHAAESNKSQLLTLLQLVDDQYSHCLDEIHIVVSAFHAVTELDPHIHAHFALQTMSLLYKDLRERISNHILALGLDSNNSCSKDKELSVETSLIEKQWALQQLKRKDQLWRPQRGLAETSVSVLRAWMFQNFLHPYPNDAEKHLLAVKSGLTRSQVSNWFINARVRLWKPMIEEMYAEMDRRKALRNEEEMESSHNRSSTSMVNYQMFNINN